MLSPKMQRGVRVNDSQLVTLSERAHFDHSLSGYLHKKTADNTKWQLRWFVLYQVSDTPVLAADLLLRPLPASYSLTYLHAFLKLFLVLKLIFSYLLFTVF